jgi:hypothetical protein
VLGSPKVVSTEAEQQAAGSIPISSMGCVHRDKSLVSTILRPELGKSNIVAILRVLQH